MRKLQRLFKEPRLAGLETGSKEWFDVQREIILSRPLLKKHYDLWYDLMLKDEGTVPKAHKGIVVELGAGGSYIKQIRPDVITSDIIDGVADMTIDATKLPFKDNSVRAIFLTHVFHHIPDVESFLSEAQRVLVPGGVISMVETTSTPFGRFFFDKFHPEPHDPRAEHWQFQANHNMHDSNQALSWIVFKRDKQRFHDLFPHLDVERMQYLPYLSYMFSGGVSRKNFVPKFTTPIFSAMDWVSKPLHPVGSLIWHIRIRKHI